jgi:polar amino acid transport system substrate-binding protein
MKAMLLSRPYYTATTYYFYSRRRYPNGPAIKSLADLQQYRICGVRGYNYAGYGLATGSIDQGAGDFTALIAKLHLGRCQLFLEKNEVMMGYAAIGRDYLADPDIGRAPMPGLKPVQFHLGISRHFPQAEALRTLLDAELAKMEQSGRLHDIWQRAVQHLKP